MLSDVPETETPVINGRFAAGWLMYFKQIFQALMGWNQALTKTVTLNFPSVSAQSQQSLTVTVTGARSTGTPLVLVQPAADVSGVIFTGAVTADNTVTVYAKNYTAGAIDPASQTYRITVLQ